MRIGFSASVRALLRNRAWIGASGWVLLGQAAPWGVALLVLPLYWKTLGAGRMGLVGILWALFAHAASLDLGIGRALAHAVSRSLGEGDPHRARRMAWKGIGAQLLLGSLIGIGIWPWIPNLLQLVRVPMEEFPEATGAFRLSLLALPAILVSAGLRAALEGAGAFTWSAAGRLLSQAGGMLLPLVLLWLQGEGLHSVARGLLLAWWGTAGLYAFAVWRRLGRPIRHSVPGELAGLFRYGIWVSFSALLGAIFLYADRFWIGRQLGPEAVGLYVLFMEPMARLLVLPGSVSTVLIPIYSRPGGMERLPPLWVALFIGLLLAPLLAGLLLLVDPLLTWWTGKSVSAPPGLLPWLALGVLVNGMAQVPFSVLYGVGRPRTVALCHVLELPLYGLLLLWAVAYGGLAGAAAAWAGRMLLDALLLTAAASIVRRSTPDRRERIAPSIHASNR